jgi:carboxypeptidase Q
MICKRLAVPTGRIAPLVRGAACVFVLMSASVIAAESAPDSDALTLGQHIERDSEAFALVRELTSTIGPRMSASDRGTSAEDFVFQKLRSFGVRGVRFEPFPMVSWKRGSAELSINGKQVRTAAMVYAPSHADLTAAIAEVGSGTSADYAADYDKVRGKIALIYMGTLPDSPVGTPTPRWERLALAIGHGAVGVIFINPTSGHHLVTGIAGGSAKVVPVPVVAVERETGLELREELRQGDALQAHIQLENAVGSGVARNVIATIRGSEHPEQIVVLAGHLDSLDLATGAVDDGSGAMWVLDVARAFAKYRVRPKRTVQFIFFMGEEEGLLGSYAHVRHAVREDTMGRVWYMINTDMSVDPDGLWLWGGDPDLAFFRSFAAEVRKMYPYFTDASTDMADGSQSSDSQPYVEHGVPIAYLKAQLPDGLLACVHAECDDMHWLTDQRMRRSAVIGAMLVLTLANAPSTIAHVLTPSETADYYKRANISRGYLGPAEN